jgi:hypothetical protein
MNPTEVQARVKARVWQEIAQSQSEFADIPHEKLGKLVDLATNAALLEFDDEIDEVIAKEKLDEELVGAIDEKVLWQGRPFLTISRYYVITNERVRIMSGLLGKEREDVELIRIQDMDQRQTLRERFMNVGDIYIRSHDPSHPHIILNNVRDPQQVHEILRRAVLDARSKHGLYYREEM